MPVEVVKPGYVLTFTKNFVKMVMRIDEVEVSTVAPCFMKISCVVTCTESLACLLHIRDIPSLNLGSDASYSEVFRGFPRSH